MAKWEKHLEKMRNNPAGDFTIEQVRTVAEHFECTERNTGGSHTLFTAPDGQSDCNVPARRPIKPVWIKKFVAFIDDLDAKMN